MVHFYRDQQDAMQQKLYVNVRKFSIIGFGAWNNEIYIQKTNFQKWCP